MGTRTQELYLQILYRGLLHIRLAASEGDTRQCFLSAVHLHNLPEHIRTTDEQWRKYYWTVERIDYLEQCKNPVYLTDFYPLWNELEELNP